MSYAERHTVSVTTDGDGDATEYSPVVTGRILAVIYTKTDFADGVDFTITTETTGQGVWTESNVNAAKTVYPRAAATDQVGTAVTFDGTNEIYVPIWAAAERMKIVVASGGDTKSGSFDVIVG